jgi:hypothetical protein
LIRTLVKESALTERAAENVYRGAIESLRPELASVTAAEASQGIEALMASEPWKPESAESWAGARHW